MINNARNGDLDAVYLLSHKNTNSKESPEPCNYFLPLANNFNRYENEFFIFLSINFFNNGKRTGNYHPLRWADPE